MRGGGELEKISPLGAEKDNNTAKRHPWGEKKTPSGCLRQKNRSSHNVSSEILQSSFKPGSLPQRGGLGSFLNSWPEGRVS